jgi:hypothetical protein
MAKALAPTPMAKNSLEYFGAVCAFPSGIINPNNADKISMDAQFLKLLYFCGKNIKMVCNSVVVWSIKLSEPSIYK